MITFIVCRYKERGVDLNNIIYSVIAFVCVCIAAWFEVEKFLRNNVSYNVFDTDRRKALFLIALILVSLGLQSQYMKALGCTIVIVVYALTSNILTYKTYKITKSATARSNIMIISMLSVLSIIIALLGASNISI